MTQRLKYFVGLLIYLSLFSSMAHDSHGPTDHAPSANPSNAQDISSGSSAGNSCRAITDGLCKNLWSKKNQGILKVHDGELLVGDSKKSDESLVSLANSKAIIDSEKNLPPDLRKHLSPKLKKLKKQIENESFSDDWDRGLSRIYSEIDDAISKTSEERVYKKRPDLQNKSINLLNYDERELFRSEKDLARTQFLDAKYANHPNWLRVKDVFQEAKSDIESAISEMNLPIAKKEKMLERLKTVELTLPYEDPKILGAEKKCSGTEENAFYQPDKHKFTVCAGLFNGLKSKSALYFTISHEIGHSMDGNRSALKEYLKNGKIVTTLKELVRRKKPLACSEWNAKVHAIEGANLTNTFSDPLQNLYNCISPKEKLDVSESKEKAVGHSIRTLISNNATNRNFLKIAQPTKTLTNGKTVPNEYYRRPDRLIQEGEDQERSVNLYEIFNQSLECAEISKDGKTYRYSDAPKEVRAEVFNHALEETQFIASKLYYEEIQYCGSNCGGNMQAFNLSKSSDEGFSDWIASKAFEKFLARKKNIEERKEASALSTVLFCERPGVIQNAQDLARAEAAFSLEPHPEGSLRRISIYSKSIRKSVNCELQKGEKGNSECEL